MGVSRCTVAFTDTDGTSHEVCVHAESLYEAVGLAVAEFTSAEVASVSPGSMTEFTVSVHREAITHRLKFNQVTRWAQGGGRSPHDVLNRNRVKKLLGFKERVQADVRQVRSTI
jgi:hypothetical protein